VAHDHGCAYKPWTICSATFSVNWVNSSYQSPTSYQLEGRSEVKGNLPAVVRLMLPADGRCQVDFELRELVDDDRIVASLEQ